MSLHIKRSQPRRRLSAMIALSAALVLPACSSEPAAGDAGTVTVTFAEQMGALEKLAEVSGLFEDTPYNLEWATLKTAPEVAQAVQSGSATLGAVGDLTPILLAAAAPTEWTGETAPFKVTRFAGLTDQTLETAPPFQLLAPGDSPIRSYADLRGKKLAFQSGGTINLYALRALTSAGLTLDDVDHIELDTRSGATALINGSVDAWIGNALFVEPPLEAGARVVGTSNDPQAFTPSLAAYISPTAALQNPELSDALGDFISRLDALSQWRIEHPEETRQAYVSALQVTPETAESFRIGDDHFSHVIDEQVLDQQQRLADEALAQGFITRPVDVRTYFDNRYNDIISADYQKYSWNPNLVSIPSE